MLNQTIMGSGFGNTFSGYYWVGEEGISHGWGKVAEGKVYVLLFWHGKLEHRGVLSLCMGIKTGWLESPMKLVRCFGLPKPCEFFKGLDNHIKWCSLGIVLTLWMLPPSLWHYKAWAVCLCMNWVLQHNYQISKDHSNTSATTTTTNLPSVISQIILISLV